MRDIKTVKAELKLLYMRLAELDLILDSLDGDRMTYLGIIEKYHNLTNKKFAYSEKQKIFDKLKLVTDEYLKNVKDTSEARDHMSDDTKTIVNEIRRDNIIHMKRKK